MITLWHNPRCSKSRDALKLLEAMGAEVKVRRYLDEPPTLVEVEAALAALGLAPVEMMRTGEPVFRELGLGADSDEAVLKQAMVAHPILIERPIAFRDGRAVIGRPPDDVLNLL